MNTKYLEEKKNSLIAQAKAMLDKAELEKRALDDEELAAFDALKKEIEDIKMTLKNAGLIKDEDVTEEKTETTTTEETQESADSEAQQRAIDDEKNFADYLRGRATNLRATSNLVDANGVTIPETIANRIWTKVVDKSPILQRCTKYNLKGDLVLPQYDETTNSITVAFAEEFTELESHIGDFKQITLTGYLAGALSLISNKLINNSQFDIVGFVVDQMADSISGFCEKTILNGGGSVEGLTGVTQTITTASSTVIAADELVDLKDSVKDVFQQNAIWIMNSATRTALRKLKDAEGRYLLNDDISSPFGTTLMGKPVYVSDNMPVIGAGKTAIYYGDMKGLVAKFSEDSNIQVLREKYATQHATGVVAWVEFDAKVADTQAIAKLVCKA